MHQKKARTIGIIVLIEIFLWVMGIQFVNLLPFTLASPIFFVFYYIFLRSSTEFSLRNLQLSQDIILLGKKGGRKFKGVALLEIQDIPKSMVVKEKRRNKTAIERLMIPGNEQYLHYHLTVLAKFSPALSFELKFSQNSPKIRLILTHVCSDSNQLIQQLRYFKELIKLVFKRVFQGLRIESLTGNALKLAWGDIFGEWGNYKFKFVEKNKIQIFGRAENIFLAILEMHNMPFFQLINNKPQLDTLLKGLYGTKMDLTFINSAIPVNIHTFKENLPSVRDKGVVSRITEDLEKMITNELVNLRHSEKTAFWETSSYFVIRSNNPSDLDYDIQRVKALISSLYDMELLSLTSRPLKRAFSRIALRNRLFHPINLTSEQLAILTHFPEDPAFQMTQSEVREFELPPERVVSKGIQLGKILFGSREMYPFHLELELLKRNLFISGVNGTGKTRMCLNLLKQLAITHPDVLWVCFDWIGEYKSLMDSVKDIKIFELKPGADISPLQLNFFDPKGSNSEEHARKVLALFREVFDEIQSQNDEATSQIATLIDNTLKDVITDPKKRNLEYFINELTFQTRKLHDVSNQILKLLQPFLNILKNLKGGAMKHIFDVDKTNFDVLALLKQKTIIDISALLADEVSHREVQLLMNLLLKYILDKVLESEVTDELKYLIVIENAETLAPAILREVPETHIMEDIPFLLRSVGVSVLSVSSHPQLPSNLIYHSGVKIIFRTQNAYKVAEFLNINKSQERYIQNMPKREAIIMIPTLDIPFRIYTEYIDLEVSSPVPQFDEGNPLSFPPQDPEAITDSDRLMHILKRGPQIRANLIDQLSITEQQLDQLITPYLKTKQIVVTLKPKFQFKGNEVVYCLLKDESWLKNEIAAKLEEDFLRSGIIGKLLAGDPMDYIIYDRVGYLKIYAPTGKKLELRLFNGLLLEWYENVVNRGGTELLIIISLQEWASLIKTHLNSNDNIKICAYNQEEWGKLGIFLKGSVIKNT